MSVPALPLEGYARETADDKAPPTPNGSRTFTEGETYALVADNVQRETAELTGKVKQLETEKADLQSKLDVAEAARETEKAAKEAAVQELADYKQTVEAEKAAVGRREERVGKVREVAKHLKDEFFTPERAQRWSEMDDEAFAAYIKELAELAPAGSTTGNQPPRETAMAGKSVEGTPKKGGLAAFWGLSGKES